MTLTGRRFIGRTYDLADHADFELRPDGVCPGPTHASGRPAPTRSSDRTLAIRLETRVRRRRRRHASDLPYALSLGGGLLLVGVPASTAAFVGVPGALLWRRLAARTECRQSFVPMALGVTSTVLAVMPLVRSPWRSWTPTRRFGSSSPQPCRSWTSSWSTTSPRTGRSLASAHSSRTWGTDG